MVVVKGRKAEADLDEIVAAPEVRSEIALERDVGRFEDARIGPAAVRDGAGAGRRGVADPVANDELRLSRLLGLGGTAAMAAGHAVQRIIAARAAEQDDEEDEDKLLFPAA